MTFKIYQPLEIIIEILKPVNSLIFLMNGTIIKNTSKKDKNQLEISD